MKLIPINVHIARQDLAWKVLNFGRQSSCAAHTFAGSAEPVSSLMRSELTRGRALAVEVIHHALDLGFHCARSYSERAVLALGDENRGFPRSSGRGPLVPKEPYVILG